MIKLGDFGIARVLSETKSKAKTVVGTPYYLSPEIIQSKPYSFKSDIWSLGVLLYEMCALQPPFNAQSLHQLARKIIVGSYADVPPHFSKDITNLLSAQLNVNPDKRPNVNQILSYPVIKARVAKLLNEQDFKDEFSHTILHSQNVFDEFKAIQSKKKDDELKQKQAEEAAKAAEKMAALKLNEYKPKYGQDPQLFNEMFMNYIDHLHKSGDTEPQTPSSDAISQRPFSQQTSITQDEDRKDDDTQSI